MHQHGPTELPGPVRGSGAWWRGMGAQPEEIHEGTQVQVRNQRTRKSKKAPGGGRPVRAELVERVRGEIAAGMYDTPEKWDAALDRLLNRLEGD